MSKTVVVAINHNFTDSFLASALETARHCDARIAAVHVVDLTHCYAGLGDSNYGLVVGAMLAYGRAALARAMTTLNDNPRGADAHLLTLPVRGSHIGREIASVCDASNAELVLLGARKRVWWQVIGEDVAATLRKATRTPVQIVRAAPGCQTTPQTSNAHPGVRNGQRRLQR
ncbi:universal stress protein [Burkholderia dolosa]|jgi:nucleotide-binding universal stress UspA family protein|uniref:universal stress protein n=1 Tax=Burkholderia dolosa TaxID=152500 RepID=UPI001B97C5BA|nr:universal stress protein [Burkholderia dolosa]MBR8302435.1 universal stress protein [Burkholderia dolosa]